MDFNLLAEHVIHHVKGNRLIPMGVTGKIWQF